MATVKVPDRVYSLGESPPSIGQKVVSWPWGGTPHLTQWSLDALKYPLGTIIIDTIDGHPVIAQIQTHDTYGAHPEWGVSLHKGTSVFVPVVVDGSTGKEVAMRSPPDGWGVSPMAGQHREGHRERDHDDRRRLDRDRLDPYVATAQYLAQGQLPPPSAMTPPATPQSQPTQPQPQQESHHMPGWREHFAKIPKLGVLAGAAIAGALVGGGLPGAIVGFGLALVADKEVRGGPWLPDFHADFGIGTIIPSSGPKTYQTTDVTNGTQTLITGKSPDDAVNQNLGRLYPGATTAMRLPGTDTFQTDKGDTFRVGLAG